MSLNTGKRDIAAIAEVLEQDHATVEDAAKAVLEAAFSLYESKAKFTIVGQLYYSPNEGWLSPDDARACMVALGRYGTEKAAENDALSFAIGTATGEQFRAWVLPVHHGTPASYFAKRKKAKAAAAEVPPGPQSIEAALARLGKENGWRTDEELAEEAAHGQHCEECGQSLTPADPLESGYEVKRAA